MRKLSAALAVLALMTLTGAAAGEDAAIAPASGRSFQSVYSVTARGMNVGEFNFSFNQTGATYQATAQRRLTGFARMLANSTQDFSYSVQGAVGDDGALHPAAYQHSGGSRHRVVRAAFSANDVVTTAVPHMGMGNPPATQAQKRGVLDQISAIASMVTAQGDPCARTVHVYMDGRSRFDFVMTPNGQVNVDSPAYRGPAFRCRVQFQPIAGFSDPQEAAELTFLFAPTATGMFAPVRIEMPSDDAGLIILNAQRLIANGQSLR